MRVSGVVDDVRRLGPHDHVCWAFDGGAELAAHARHLVAPLELSDGRVEAA